MTGRQAGVAGVPTKRLEGPNVVAGDEWPGPPDHMFDDIRKQARHGDRCEDKSDPHPPGRKDAAPEPRRGWRIERGQHQHENAERPEEITRLAQIREAT